MALNPDLAYVVAFASAREQPVAFGQHEVFLRRLRQRHKSIEIPFLDFEHLPPEELEAFDSYLYFPNDQNAETLLAQVNKETLGGKAFPGRFLILGVIPGSAITAMVSKFEEEVGPEVAEAIQFPPASQGPRYFKVKSGSHKRRNVTVRWESLNDETGLATVSHMIFDPEKSYQLVRFYFDIEPSNLRPAPFDPMEMSGFFRNLLKTSALKQAVIIDGDAELHEAGRRYPDLYTRPHEGDIADALAQGLEPPEYGEYVGASHGFYFSILRFRMMLPTYELHIVFDGRPEKGLGAQRCATWSDAKKAAYLANRDWVKRFALFCGAHVYELEGQRSEDQIASLVTTMTGRLNYANILIYTTGNTLFPLVSEKVELILPKVNFRDHPMTITVRDALQAFGLAPKPEEGVEVLPPVDPAMVERITWIKAIAGDLSDVPSVNTFNKDISWNYTKVRQSDYLSHVLAATDPGNLKERLVRYRMFVKFIKEGQFDRNLKSVSLKRDLFDHFNSLSRFWVEDKEGFGVVDMGGIKDCLIEASFMKEIEYLVRNYRVIAGLA